MQAFATVLDELSFTPSRNGKLALLEQYFRATPDPDRGWALAALTDGLPLRFPMRRIISDLMAARIDPVLFKLSRDYVGDTAETVALLWPDAGSSVSGVDRQFPQGALGRATPARHDGHPAGHDADRGGCRLRPAGRGRARCPP